MENLLVQPLLKTIIGFKACLQYGQSALSQIMLSAKGSAQTFEVLGRWQDSRHDSTADIQEEWIALYLNRGNLLLNDNVYVSSELTNLFLNLLAWLPSVIDHFWTTVELWITCWYHHYIDSFGLFIRFVDNKIQSFANLILLQITCKK